MAGQFGTQTDTMRTAAQHVIDVNEQIQRQLRTLHSQLAPLAGTWRGQASVAFQELMVRWNEDATRMNRALHAIGETIQGSGQAYATTEEDTRSSISSIRSTLG